MYDKSDILSNYDVFPKVLVKGKKTAVHIRPLGGRREFEPGKEYTLVICALDDGFPRDYPSSADFKERKIVCNEEGGFTVEHTFDSEQEYFLRFQNDEGKRINQFSVYCVEEDLNGRYPYIGDMHMHTNFSDGQQLPEVVAANYRSYGYDFTVISDHGRYYPSLRCINKYKDVPVEMEIVCGEEVHLPAVYGVRNDVHIVNFGGEYSINALTAGSQWDEVGQGKEFRSLNGECPDTITYDEFQAKIQKLADEAELPDSVERIPYVMCKWIFDEIRKAKGLGIFAHPTWRSNVYQVPERFQDYMFETHPFDAFEVLGGERYYEHNGFQTVRYYEEKAKGNIFPIVGSTDSHSSLPSNAGAFICETMVFCENNERTEIIKAVKDYYSLAIDTISKEFRLVGDKRFVRYGCFLLKNFFPLHDELAYEEGRMMLSYVTGTEEEKETAAETLKCISGRMKKQREKYFDFN